MMPNVRSNGWMDFIVSKVVTSQDLEDVLQREAKFVDFWRTFCGIGQVNKSILSDLRCWKIHLMFNMSKMLMSGISRFTLTKNLGKLFRSGFSHGWLL